MKHSSLDLSLLPSTSSSSCGPSAGLHRDRATAGRRQRRSGGAALLRPRGGRLRHQLPAAVPGLRHQPLWAAGRSHVRLHLYVRLRERRLDQGEARTPAGGGAGGGQSAGGRRL